MIYEMVSPTAEVNPDVVLRRGRIIEIEERLPKLKAEIENEDSKRREAELTEEFKALKKEAFRLHNEITGIEEEIFKTLLSAEYDFPQTHPKFGKVYSYAYQQGHSSGWSEVEIYFSDLVDIVKD